MATFPGSAPSFATLVDLVDSVLASHQNTPNGEIVAIANFILNSMLRQGQLINGKFTRTVSSNNLTVAIKAADGTDPSSTNPVYVMIGGTIRTITAALSVTVNAGAASGAGTFNLGAVEFATIEQDVFVYLGWKASSSAVFVGISRIPYGRVYSDFSATAANEKYIAVSSTPASTDEVENIGRFNITNSGTASYNWSVPATDVTINRRIEETRWLTWAPVYSASGSLTYTSVSTTWAKNKLRGNATLEWTLRASGTLGGTASTQLFSTGPFESSQVANNPVCGVGNTATVSAKVFMSGGTPDLITWSKYDTSNYATSGSNTINGEGFYET